MQKTSHSHNQLISRLQPVLCTAHLDVHVVLDEFIEIVGQVHAHIDICKVIDCKKNRVYTHVLVCSDFGTCKLVACCGGSRLERDRARVTEIMAQYANAGSI